MPLQQPIHYKNVAQNLFLLLALWLLFIPFIMMVSPAAISALGSATAQLGSGENGSTPGNASVSPSVPADNQGDGASASFNWSGYAAIGTFTGVSGSWIVPNISPDTTFASDATWVGIGGVASTDLIQTGTQASIEDGSITYHAWYELLPGSMVYVPLKVHAGDHVSASLVEDRPGIWQIVLANSTTGTSYQERVAYNSSHSSAEWIEERPSLARGGLLPLADFGTLNWASAYALSNGTQISAAQAGAEQIAMLSRNGTTIATPSGLGSAGSSFTIVRNDTVPIASASNPPPIAVEPPGITIEVPISPRISPSESVPGTSENSYSETSVSSSGSSGDHGSYYVWVNGKLVEKKEW